jgi:hypothetical protein
LAYFILKADHWRIELNQFPKKHIIIEEPEGFEPVLYMVKFLAFCMFSKASVLFFMYSFILSMRFFMLCSYTA